ncbi:MAG: hypothetical protein Q7U82_04955 [Gammaproteobacteria bacterium]|nr:hypothetical protein [Gammaproteobacteria bacterium]
MSVSSPVIIRNEEDVQGALQKIGLTREVVEKIAFSAAAARADTLPVDPSNAPGQLSYIYGVRAVRLSLLKEGWRVCRAGNVESTVNDKLGVRLCFQNVDAACNPFKNPHAISGKGNASRNLVAAGQGELFVNEEGLVGKPVIGSNPTVWVICVAVDDAHIRAEVSCPESFEGAQFENFHQRIFVVDQELTPITQKHDLEIEEEFDVAVSKK